MTERHIIVGAGPVGRHLAQQLVDDGIRVSIVSRSGRATGVRGAEHLALDASDPDALSRSADRADVLYNCANPGDYTQWDHVWPPLAASLLTAAERTGAVYAITGTLYPYGPVDAPMREGMPDAATDHKGRLRAEMWRDALRLHEEGRIRAVEVRGSDYMGRGVGQNGHISRHLPGARRGKAAWVFGRTDQPHTFTDVADVARTLSAAARDEGAHGRIWHVPSNAPVTQRQAIRVVLASADIEPVPVRSIPMPLVAASAPFVPFMKEIRDMTYQWVRPYVLDDRDARDRFGISPTPWDEVCRRTATADLATPAPAR